MMGVMFTQNQPYKISQLLTRISDIDVGTPLQSSCRFLSSWSRPKKGVSLGGGTTVLLLRLGQWSRLL